MLQQNYYRAKICNVITLEIEEDQLEWVSLRIYYIFLYTIGNEILFRVEFENYIRSQSN